MRLSEQEYEPYECDGNGLRKPKRRWGVSERIKRNTNYEWCGTGVNGRV